MMTEAPSFAAACGVRPMPELPPSTTIRLPFHVDALGGL